jgi:deoxycytidine triphosphate deaminase
MTVLTDRDIERYLNSEIVISPLNRSHITPVGYDISVGTFVYLLDGTVVDPDPDGNFFVPAQATALLLSAEHIYVSKRIAGTVHSCVGNVARGFSHISTTLDPGWSGAFLIAVTNMTSQRLALKTGAKLATVVFMKVNSPADRDHGYEGGHPQIIASLEARSAADSRRLMAAYIHNEQVNKTFLEKRTPPREFLIGTATAIRKQIWRRRGQILGLMGVLSCWIWLPAGKWAWEQFLSEGHGPYDDKIRNALLTIATLWLAISLTLLVPRTRYQHKIVDWFSDLFK